ncbi:response regulator transcription factor [Streptomyces sp. JNUCC 64]
MSGAVRVLVADDQNLFRESLALLIDSGEDLTVVAEATTGEDAFARALAHRPDVVLMDIRMPGGDGIEATRRISAEPGLAGTRVLVLSMFELDEYVYSALRAGASGFLLKDARPAELLDAVRRTHAGDSLFAPSILTRLVEHYLDRPTPGPARTVGLGHLTPRETDVLLLVARGRSNDEIAQDLVLSVKTVKTHIGNLLAKLRARDRAQLVIAAYRGGLVVP